MLLLIHQWRLRLDFIGIMDRHASDSDPKNYINTKTWLTLVYAYDGRQSKFYVNRQLISTVPGSATFTPNSNHLLLAGLKVLNIHIDGMELQMNFEYII